MIAETFHSSSYIQHLPQFDLLRWRGTVSDVTGQVIESQGPATKIGGFCEIHTSSGRVIRTQVVGFRNSRILSMPLEEIDGLEPGDAIYARSDDAQLGVGPGLLGRVLDGFGRPMDGGPPIEAQEKRDLYAAPPGPLDREHIQSQLVTGVRAIDGMLPCGLGQRIGLFGGSGVGKSTLLGAMSKQNSADVTVIALIGERNREVRAFLEHELGPEGQKRSVVVVATSDRPAPLRLRACYVALAAAEYFRDQGANVLLVMDSVTRLAMRNESCRPLPANRPVRKAIRLRFSACSPRSLSERVRFIAEPSPASLPCWLKVTISMSRSRTRFGVSWTVTSSCRANLELRAITLQSMFCLRSLVWLRP